MQLYKFESIFNRSIKFGLPEWATDESCDVFKARAQFNLSSKVKLKIEIIVLKCSSEKGADNRYHWLLVNLVMFLWQDPDRN